MVGTACPPDLEYPKNEDRIPYTSADVNWPESNPLPNNSVVFRPAHIKNIPNYGFPQPTSQGNVFLWFNKIIPMNHSQTPENRVGASRAINH